MKEKRVLIGAHLNAAELARFNAVQRALQRKYDDPTFSRADTIRYFVEQALITDDTPRLKAS